MTESLAQIRECKSAHKDWIIGGRPSNPHPLAVSRKLAKTTLRKLQRRWNATKRENHHSQIMDAQTHDQRFMHKLIAMQRSKDNSLTSDLIVGDTRLTEIADITEAWKQWFSDLASPSANPLFDAKYKSSVDRDRVCIADHCADTVHTVIPFSAVEVQHYIQKLNRNKAMDENNIAAEHLLIGSPSVSTYLANLFSAMWSMRYIPENFNSGFIIPVYKKGGKPQTDRNSYRGITISSIIGKLFEHIVLGHYEHTVQSTQNPLQCGFTRGASPAHAALIFTEVLNEARDNKRPLYAATLDAQKAFDVVDHSSLMRKLYLAGIPDTIWLLKNDMYKALTSRVRYNDVFSEVFEVSQGVRQGGILSTTDYKLYINELLDNLENANLGCYLGDIYCGAPTCADDVLLLAPTALILSSMINLTSHYASRERYVLHPTKSTVMVYNSPVNCDTWQKANIWDINRSPLQVVNNSLHLGIERCSTPNQRISNHVNNKISIARRTLYSLMGAGLHGLTGLNPIASTKIYNTYVLPRLLTGLESVNLTKHEMDELERFHRQNLRHFQNLSPNTACEAIYFLIGALPLEAHLHIRCMTLFGAITRKPDSTVYRIAQRQLIMKDIDSSSWFSQITVLLYKYGLPSPLELLVMQPGKTPWKKMVNSAVSEFWNQKFYQSSQEKVTLTHMNFNGCSVNKPHHVWSSTAPHPRDIRRATIKAKLITGTYILQNSRAKWDKQGKTSSLCPLCKIGSENIEHFVIKCSALNNTRYPYLQNIVQFLSDHNINTDFIHQTNLLVQLILDASHVTLKAYLLPLCDIMEQMNKLETITRSLCFALHFRRAQLLNYRP